MERAPRHLYVPIETPHHASSSSCSAKRRTESIRSAIGHVLPGTHRHRPGQQRDRRTIAGLGRRSKGQRPVHLTGQLANDRPAQSSTALHLPWHATAPSTERARSGQEKEKSSTPSSKGRHRASGPGPHAATTSTGRAARALNVANKKRGYKKKRGTTLLDHRFNQHGAAFKRLANAAPQSKL